MTGVTVEPERGDIELFGAPVSEMQSDVNVVDGKIIGTLHFIEGGLAQSGPLAGDGNFLALKFSSISPNATSVKVGLKPSQGSGLVEILTDPDKNGVFKITNKNTQKFRIESKDADNNTLVQEFDLKSLVLENS